MRYLGSAALCNLIVLAACTGAPAGPKRIEADGNIYIACSGAIWIPSAKDTAADNTPTTYVFFKDPDGKNRELKRVRTLLPTKLPDSAPECATRH